MQYLRVPRFRAANLVDRRLPLQLTVRENCHTFRKTSKVCSVDGKGVQKGERGRGHAWTIGVVRHSVDYNQFLFPRFLDIPARFKNYALNLDESDLLKKPFKNLMSRS